MKINGQKVYKHVDFKVFDSLNRKSETFRVPAEPGAFFTDSGIELVKMNFAAHLNEKFPDKIWQFVRTGKAQYNVLHEVGSA
jgi:hypothetical protein